MSFFEKIGSLVEEIEYGDAGLVAVKAIDASLDSLSKSASKLTEGEMAHAFLRNLTSFADLIDEDGFVNAADTLDCFIALAQDTIWPSAEEVANARYDAREGLYGREKHHADSLYNALEKQPKVEKNENVIETYQGPGATSLLTRHSPDYPGVALMRVTDGVYQDTMTRKIYDFNNGFVSEKGQKYPGGSVSHQTPASVEYLGFGQELEGRNLRTRPR